MRSTFFCTRLAWRRGTLRASFQQQELFSSLSPLHITGHQEMQETRSQNPKMQTNTEEFPESIFFCPTITVSQRQNGSLGLLSSHILQDFSCHFSLVPFVLGIKWNQKLRCEKNVVFKKLFFVCVNNFLSSLSPIQPRGKNLFLAKSVSSSFFKAISILQEAYSIEK